MGKTEDQVREQIDQQLKAKVASIVAPIVAEASRLCSSKIQKRDASATMGQDQRQDASATLFFVPSNRKARSLRNGPFGWWRRGELNP
jgi:hypothetical protein